MELKDFFEQNPNVAIAFSGGVDSSYLLYVAMKYGKKVKAYYIKSAFQPQFEYDDAMKMIDHLKADVKVIEVDALEDERVAANPTNRCYYCKLNIFSKIIESAVADGFEVLIDGTNATDDADDRPGMKALQELKVISPLRECGLTKDEIRRLSKEAGLFTWNKPAYACLATRIPAGIPIDEQMLANTEKAEGILFDMGFTDFRIRYFEGCARIQIVEEQMPILVEKRKDILAALKPYYRSVMLDLEVR